MKTKTNGAAKTAKTPRSILNAGIECLIVQKAAEIGKTPKQVAEELIELAANPPKTRGAAKIDRSMLVEQFNFEGEDWVNTIPTTLFTGPNDTLFLGRNSEDAEPATVKEALLWYVRCEPFSGSSDGVPTELLRIAAATMA
jgi:hypothetical protein